MLNELTSLTKRSWQEAYLDRYYRSRANWIDGTTEFHEMIRRQLGSAREILELGPGPQNRTTDFLASHYVVDGLDVDEDSRTNPALRQAYVYQGGAWPVADASYDAIVANYVLEHLDRPAETMAEVARVLRPGGTFVFRTPNFLYYVSLVSWMTPHWFHKLVANRLRKLPADHHDPYPTCYRMNRRGTLRSLARGAGLEPVELTTIEKEPSYGMASRVLFLTFMAYERLVNSCNCFAPFRANILGAIRKPLK